MRRTPKISVTIPALNESETILKLLKSFRDQTCRDFEVIVVDNGSTDNTRDLVLEEIHLELFPLKLLSEEKKGVGFARRKGMDDALTRGVPYLAGTDADSVLPSNWIESIIGTFEETSADCLFGLSDLDWSCFKDRTEVYEMFTNAWTARTTVARHIGIPPRGVNFAITSLMYHAVGGMPQPQNESGVSQPGEDIELKSLIEKVGGKIADINSVVLTSPRRAIRALIKETPDDYYQDMEDVRGEKEVAEEALKLNIQSFKKFIDATLRRLFKAYFIKNAKTSLWPKVKIFLEPKDAEFVADAELLDGDEMYEKYKNILMHNAKRLADESEVG